MQEQRIENQRLFNYLQTNRFWVETEEKNSKYKKENDSNQQQKKGGGERGPSPSRGYSFLK